ncbi:MAG: type I 3-dehydroquinate dehydratase [Methanopyri archaeon]|nr:type I 3-dehydroquinate dehydratase [Methanopyri archaeon]
MIIATLTGGSPEEMMDQARRAVRAGADAVEVRIDLLEDDSLLEEAVDAVYRHADIVVATYRREVDGGKYSGDEARRLKVLAEASEMVDLVDVELDVMEEGGVPEFWCDVIVSYHDFEGCPSRDELAGLVERCLEHGDVAKVVPTAENGEEAVRIVDVVAASDGDVIGFAMGEEGKWTRVVTLLVGGFATYAAVDEAVAPGQLTVEEVVRALEVLG